MDSEAIAARLTFMSASCSLYAGLLAESNADDHHLFLKLIASSELKRCARGFLLRSAVALQCDIRYTRPIRFCSTPIAGAA